MGNMNVRMRIELNGIPQFEQALRQQQKRAMQAAEQALYDEGNEIMAVSIPMVPVDTGALQQSNFVDKPVTDKDEVRVRIGYGGQADRKNPKSGQMASEYAVIVHENLAASHDNGSAKFLETPVNAASRSMETRVGNRIQRIL